MIHHDLYSLTLRHTWINEATDLPTLYTAKIDMYMSTRQSNIRGYRVQGDCEHVSINFIKTISSLPGLQLNLLVVGGYPEKITRYLCTIGGPFYGAPVDV
jgi:hypothetical protein